MGLVIVVAAIGWALGRLARQDAGKWALTGWHATVYWSALGAIVGFGSVTMLFIVLLPVAAVMVGFSFLVDPSRAWLVPAGVAAPLVALIGTRAAPDADGLLTAASGFFLVLAAMTALAIRAIEIRRGRAGGQTAGGQTAGGQTAGGQTAGGQTAGGQTAGGQTAGGQTAGGQT